MLQAALSAHQIPPVSRLAPEYSAQDMPSLVKSSFCTMSYEVAPGTVSPMTRFKGIGLGSVDVFRHEGIGRRTGSRSLAHIRNHWVDDFVISMPLDAKVSTRQGGHVAVLNPGSFVFLSTARPFFASLGGARADDVCSALLVRISGPLLRARAPLLDDCCGVPLSLQAGAGKIMRTLFELALTEGAALSQAQLAGFNDMLLAAVTSVAVESSESDKRQRPRLRALDRVREEAIVYIQCHLSNPALGPGEIAQHCKVSERYLQTAFAAADMTVGGSIRENRLQQCRAALRNPGLRDNSVIDIALRWGFCDAPYFSRAYKARFGKPPSAERH